MKLNERKAKFLQTDIYPVITPNCCKGRSPLFVLEETLKGGARVVQLRDKKEPERYAADFRKITNKFGALLIINNFIDIAIKCGADGVHLGLEDYDIGEARKKAPELLIGASINTLEEALNAQKKGASYINIGVSFLTNTKRDIKQVTGLKAIVKIGPRLKVPFTVIGGINRSNIHEVLKCGAGHIAMVTAISEAKDVERETRELIGMIRNGTY